MKIVSDHPIIIIEHWYQKDFDKTHSVNRTHSDILSTSVFMWKWLNGQSKARFIII